MKNKVLKFLPQITLSIGAILLTYFSLFHKLGLENINNDQLRWQARTENFFTNFQNGNYKDTYQQYHPGVMLIYIIKLGYTSYSLFNENFLSWTDTQGDRFIVLNQHLKFWFQLNNLFLIIISLFCVKKLFEIRVALIFGILILTETYFLGILRNLHLDGPNALLIFTTISMYFVYLETKQTKYLIFTGLLSGLGILFKSMTIFSFLFIGLVSLFEIIKNPKFFFKISAAILSIFLLSLTVFSILFPAMWADPVGTSQKVFVEGLMGVGLSGDDNFQHHINGTTIGDPGPYYYLNILKFRLSNGFYLAIDLIILLLIYTSYKRIKLENKNSKYVFYYFLASLIFLGIITYSSKKTDRYISAFFPLIFIFTAFFLNKYLSFLKAKIFYLLISLILFVNLYFNYLFHPYYFGYYNPLLGGIGTAKNILYINQGGVAYIEVINFLKTINLKPEDKIGIYNKDEFIPAFQTKIYGLGPLDYKIKTYRIPTIARGKEFTKNSSKIFTVKVGPNTFWEIYKAK